MAKHMAPDDRDRRRKKDDGEQEYRARRMRPDDGPPQAQEDLYEDIDSGNPETIFAEPEPAEEAPPKKKKKKLGVILWIVLIVAILTLLASGGMVVWEMVIQPMMNDSTNDEIRSLAGAVTTTEDAPIDFDALRRVNGDIVGWIKIPNTRVNYPVLQSAESDPEYYLYRDYKKNDTKYGSVFLDSKASIHKGDSNGRSLTLYGHHMNDGRMFADILQYSDLDFYKRTPTFTFDTYEQTGTWKVISVFKTNVLSSQGEVFQYVRNGFSSDDDFLDFVQNVMIRSIINTGVKVNETDQLLVLSTCSYEFDDFRTVVVARRVREGEDKSVDVSAAGYNAAPLYPDCWYQNGGNKPIYPRTFAEAKAQMSAGWYDGGTSSATSSTSSTSSSGASTSSQSGDTSALSSEAGSSSADADLPADGVMDDQDAGGDGMEAGADGTTDENTP